MPLDIGGVGVETGWISKWAFQVDALAADSIGRQAIADGFVNAAKLASDAVSTIKILDGSVTAAKLSQPTLQTVNAVAFKVARASYSFATDGGAVGTIGLFGATSIPASVFIVGGILQVSTALTSGGAATAALQVEGANDIVTEAAISGAPWSTNGRKDIIPDFTGSAVVETTAARDVSLVIGTADLTAGVFDVYLFYIVFA